MAQTKIEWCDRTWNVVTGRSKVSAGCKNCYAETMFKRLASMPDLKQYYGRKFTDVQCHPEKLDQPLHWRKPQRIFVNSMSDLFHDDVPNYFINDVFNMMYRCKKHTFLILTKRPERMKQYVEALPCGFAPLPNVFYGVSVEDQQTADERIPLLLQTPASKRFISVEMFN